jgi:hypothetical protein
MVQGQSRARWWMSAARQYPRRLEFRIDRADGRLLEEFPPSQAASIVMGSSKHIWHAFASGMSKQSVCRTSQVGSLPALFDMREKD